MQKPKIAARNVALVTTALFVLLSGIPTFFASQLHAATQDPFSELVTYTAIGLGLTTFGPTTTSAEATNASGNREAHDRELAYVRSNYDALAEDIAKGTGQTYDSFEGLLECKDLAPADSKEMKEALQRRYDSILPKEQSAPEFRKSLKKAIREIDRRYVQRCKWLDRDVDTAHFIK